MAWDIIALLVFSSIMHHQQQLLCVSLEQHRSAQRRHASKAWRRHKRIRIFARIACAARSLRWISDGADAQPLFSIFRRLLKHNS